MSLTFAHGSYYRAPELIFGATDYTCDIGRFSNHLGFCQRVKKKGAGPSPFSSLPSSSIP